MKYKVIVGSFILLWMGLTQVSHAVQVGGVISNNTTWSNVKEAYKITSQIQIPAGVTLTIQPGVRVESDVVTGSAFKIHGTLKAWGSATKKVTFAGFRTVLFSNQDAGTNMLTSLKYCTIANCWSLIDYSAFGGGRFEILNSEVTNIQEASSFWFLTSSFTVQYCKFTNAGCFKFTACGGAIIKIEDNLFIGAALLFFSSSPPNVSIKRNTFWQVTGFWDFLDNPNRHFIVLDGSGYNKDLDVSGNYWWTKDRKTIDGLIYDRNDDISLSALVKYSPMLSARSPNTPSPYYSSAYGWSLYE